MREVQLIGKESEKVYVKGKSKAECLRKLQKKYPYFERINNRKRSNNQLYPETLIFVGVRSNVKKGE